ncbi:response regulator [Edaphobacter aggregans]|uniref:response regulator n=1 Tax=Edaphobacter aggregans TaxID=570835 RepID=UPI0006925219|nr:response regulator [Edaphobacter aggregans]
MTILVADDNAFSRELMREVLEQSGHVILEAVNGRDALDLIHGGLPELVFLDLQMPLQDGFGVIRELRNDSRFRNLPVVAVTASAMIGDRERAIAAGFDSYIAKPIDLTEVEAHVAALASRPYVGNDNRPHE